MLFAGFISFAFLVALVAHATTRRQLLADIVAASISTLAWLLAGTIAAGYQDKLLFVAAIGAFGEHTWPNTRHIMGWDITSDGFGVVLSPDRKSTRLNSSHQ